MDWKEVGRLTERLRPSEQLKRYLGRVSGLLPKRYRQRVLNLVKNYDELNARAVSLSLLLTAMMLPAANHTNTAGWSTRMSCGIISTIIILVLTCSIGIINEVHALPWRTRFWISMSNFEQNVHQD